MANNPKQPGEDAKSQEPKNSLEALAQVCRQETALKADNEKKAKIGLVGVAWDESEKYMNAWPGKTSNRFKRLREKYLKGRVDFRAFKAFVTTYGTETAATGKRKDERHQDLADHLLEDSKALINRGVNFKLFQEALESDDPAERSIAEELVSRKKITAVAERKAKEQIKDIRKKRVTPSDITAAVGGALDVQKLTATDPGDEDAEGTAAKRLAKEVTTEDKISVEGEPPTEKLINLQAVAKRTKQRYEESSEASKEVTILLKKLPRETFDIEANLQDPEYIKEMLEGAMKNVDLLRRAASLSEDEETSKAVSEYSDKAREYAKEKQPEDLKGNEESIHELYLKDAAASQEAKQKLYETLNSKVDTFLEALVVAEWEESLDALALEASETEVTADATKDSVQTVADKYQLKTIPKEAEEELAAKLKEAVEKAKSGHKNLAEVRRELMKENKEAQKYAERSKTRGGPRGIVEQLEKELGVSLVEEGKDGAKFPAIGRKIVLTRPREQSSGKGALDRIEKTQKGRAIKHTETIEIVDVTWDDHSEADVKALKDKSQSKQESAWAGDVTVTIKRENGTIEIRKKPSLVREFAPYSAAEVLENKSTAAKRIKEKTGIEAKLEQGEMFQVNSISSKDEHAGKLPESDVMEIKSVDEENGLIKLTKPVIDRKPDEYHHDSTYGGQSPKDTFTYGEFVSYMLRRGGQISVMTGAATAANAAASRTATGRTVADNPAMVERLSQDVTPAQRAAFLAQPLVTSKVREIDPKTSMPHWVQKDLPAGMAKAAMNLENKFEGLEGLGGGGGGDDGSSQPQEAAAEEPTDEEIAKAKTAAGKSKGKSRHYHEEALAQKDAPIEGTTHTPEEGYLHGLWRRTKVLSNDEFGELFKMMYEYYERHWHRRAKDKYASVGEGLPYWGTEMGRVKQQAETEEVNQFMEAMEDWGEWQIHDSLEKATNKDQTKACFQVLSKKGQIRWDDIGMWKTLNGLVPSGLKIPIPANGDPSLKDKITGKTGFEYAEGAIDFLWGEGTYNDWYSENNGVYDSNLKKYAEKGKLTEGDTKNMRAVEGELRVLLERHKKGGYVDAHEYEGLLHFIIDAGKGKSGIETKIYYMIQGVAQPSPTTGRSIMSLERLGAINGVYLNRFPVMDYLTRPDVPRPDGTSSAWTIHDYQKWIAEWDADAKPGMENLPTDAVTHQLWHHILTDEKTIIRNNKGLRKANEMDHDDAYGIIPLADEEIVENITMSHSGQTKFFTTEGYANVYAGYNMFWKTLSEKGEKAKLSTSIKAFAKYDGIMDKRFKKDSNQYARLGKQFWNRPSVVDSRPTGWHKRQLEDVLIGIASAYRDQKLIETVDTMHQKTGSTQDPVENEKQKKVQAALENFSKEFDRVIATDNGARMMGVIQSAGLSGMGGFVSAPERMERKKRFELENDELSQVFTDWKRDDGDDGDD